MKINREADDIYDTWIVCGNFKGKKLYTDTSALRALRVKLNSLSGSADYFKR